MPVKTALARMVAVLAVLLGGVLVTAAPAYASATACGGGQCVFVHGSGSHVDYVESWYSADPRHPYYDYGHVEVRWHAGGTDHVKNSPQGGWSNVYHVRVTLNVNVDANTYVCARFWRWNGSSWILPWGNWVCVKTHP